MMIETPWRIYEEHSITYRMRVKYGVDHDFARRHGQAPYFTITAEIHRKELKTYQTVGRFVFEAGGQLHDDIARRFPELAELLKWHLVSTEGPLHYIANAKYWWEQYIGKTAQVVGGPNPLEAFKRTVVFEALPIRDLERRSWESMQFDLENRFDELMEMWEDDMVAAGVLDG